MREHEIITTYVSRTRKMEGPSYERSKDKVSLE